MQIKTHGRNSETKDDFYAGCSIYYNGINSIKPLMEEEKHKLEEKLIECRTNIESIIRPSTYGKFNFDDFALKIKGLNGDNSISVKFHGGKKKLEKEEALAVFSFYKSLIEARNKYAPSNLKLVPKVAKNYIVRAKLSGLNFLDIIQEGNKGLMNAAERYDYRKAAFSTHAQWWIMQSIKETLSHGGSSIYLPRHLLEQYTRIIQKEKELLEMEEKITDEGISKLTGFSIEKIKRVKNAFESPVNSLDDEDFLLNNNEIENIDGDKICSIDFDENILSSKRAADTTKIMKELPPREEKILSMRFGIYPYDEKHTLEEVGKEFNVTRERIRQIEEKAKARFRRKFKKNGGTDISDYV